jgi:hypothetical protein
VSSLAGSGDQGFAVVIVGVCTSGKTTLRDALKTLGVDAYVVSQEHSSVRRMWDLRSPQYVVCLDCDIETARRRRSVYWGEEMLRRQTERLSDARDNCDLYVDTSCLGTPETVRRVMAAVTSRRAFSRLR